MEDTDLEFIEKKPVELPKRRLVAVPISFELIDQMVREGYEIKHGVKVLQGIPKDAMLVGSFTNEFQQTGYLIYSHPSFREIELNEEIPFWMPLHQRIELRRGKWTTRS